jgi:hypothetical protein
MEVMLRAMRLVLGVLAGASADHDLHLFEGFPAMIGGWTISSSRSLTVRLPALAGQSPRHQCSQPPQRNRNH